LDRFGRNTSVDRIAVFAKVLSQGGSGMVVSHTQIRHRPAERNSEVRATQFQRENGSPGSLARIARDRVMTGLGWIKIASGRGFHRRSGVQGALLKMGRFCKTSVTLSTRNCIGVTIPASA
jgi:hypothetical protein